MFAFDKASDTHLLHLTELCNQLGLKPTRKFVETFANEKYTTKKKKIVPTIVIPLPKLAI
jgi:hypothetical protein